MNAALSSISNKSGKKSVDLDISHLELVYRMNFDQDFRPSGFQDTTLKPAPKRIVICCDGTWQSSVTNVDNVPSNITRIARYLLKVGKDAKGEQWQQLVYYYAGIGTGASSLRPPEKA